MGAALEPETDALLDRGLLTTTAGRLHLTPEGRELRARAAERQLAMRERIHDGIPDEDYLATLKVLQHMIHNTGGQAWHH